MAEYLQREAPFVLTENGNGRAFGMCFRMTRTSTQADELLREPVPEIKIVDCPDEDTWRKLLLHSNAEKDGELEKQVVFLRHRKDLDRLKTAILMKKIISLNAADYILKLRNFTREDYFACPL